MRLKTQVFVGEKPEAEKIEGPTAEAFWKPQGCLWTSTLNEQGGQWVEWLLGNDFSLEDERWGGGLWLLEPDEAKICVIEDPADLWRISKRYPFRRPDINPAIQSFRVLVDWPALSREYDAVHIPNPWPWRFGDDMAASMFFYTMDAECTFWFRWRFEGEPRLLDPAELSMV